MILILCLVLHFQICAGNLDLWTYPYQRYNTLVWPLNVLPGMTSDLCRLSCSKMPECSAANYAIASVRFFSIHWMCLVALSDSDKLASILPLGLLNYTSVQCSNALRRKGDEDLLLRMSRCFAFASNVLYVLRQFIGISLLLPVTLPTPTMQLELRCQFRPSEPGDP